LLITVVVHNIGWVGYNKGLKNALVSQHLSSRTFGIIITAIPANG